jgi:hypothetical protein
MNIIMILYYILCAFIAYLLIWNFIREKDNKDHMLHYLLVLVPLVLRLFRIK